MKNWRGGCFGRSQRKCRYYNRLGHTHEVCYSLHGTQEKLILYRPTLQVIIGFFYMKENIMSSFNIKHADTSTSSLCCSATYFCCWYFFACVSESNILGSWDMASGDSDYIWGHKSLLSNIVVKQCILGLTYPPKTNSKGENFAQVI